MIHTASYSELDTFRQCPLKHELSYKQRWTQPVEEGGALDRGTRWHSLMETHYGSNRDGEEQMTTRAWFARQPDDETTELIRWMYDGYIDHWGTDPEWEVLAVESKGEMWLPTAAGTRSGFKLKYRIDLIVRDLRLGGLWVVDHKTCKNLPKGKDLDLEDQFPLYVWGLRQQGHKVLGSIYNAARTHRNVSKPQELSERFTRTRIPHSDAELDTIAVEAWRTLKTAYSYREGEAPRSPNPDTCRWRCPYTEPCLMSRQGVERQGLLRDFGFVQDFTRH